MNEDNTHRLTETDAAEMYGTDEEGHTLYAWRNPERAWVVRAMGAAFDAGREHKRTNPENARPWEPLKKGDPLHVGDEVRQDHGGITRTAVVGRAGRVDGKGDPWTAEGTFIGVLSTGTWYVRRAAVADQ